MHLLLAQKGAIDEGEEAIDLGQDPADLIFLSAADTELACLGAAYMEGCDSGFSLRVANVMQLTHPMSIDVYAENTIAKSKLVVVRVLGGESYWSYGLEKMLETALENDIKLVVLPGDDKPDPGLARFCTIEMDQCERFWDYLKEGGPQNATAMLAFARSLLGYEIDVPDPVPLLKAGIWHPEIGICDLEGIRHRWVRDQPIVAITFYRALVQSGGLQPIAALVEGLRVRGINALPLFISSLKDPVTVATLNEIFAEVEPSLVANATGFAVSSPGDEHAGTVLDQNGRMVLQIVLGSGSKESWETSSQGLSTRDLAMNVALPEIDGRVLSRAIAFKDASDHVAALQANLVGHSAEASRIRFVSDLVSNWVKLAQVSAADRKVALILANYPNQDGRLANGVGLDTPAGTIQVINWLRLNGYDVGQFSLDSNGLIEFLQQGPTNAATVDREVRETISLGAYERHFKSLPVSVQNQVTERWGAVENDPFFILEQKAFALPVGRFGNVVIAIQPARGYHIDPKETYHSPDLVPPHGYIAFYGWLRNQFEAHAIVHMGKHGNLEWLPGKALSLSEACFPEAILGPMPHLYPFIVNDPGEGTQAKRRTSAVIIDHLTPPLARAESYGPLRDLEALVDEFYEASGNDPRRLIYLKQQILDLIADIGLDLDAGISAGDGDEAKLEKLDGYLCELKEMQIRDGLHIFGQAPTDQLLNELIVALVRVPRGDGDGKNASLHRAISKDLFGCNGNNLEFDPLDCEFAEPWSLEQPSVLRELSADPWRTCGDAVERIELLASRLVAGEHDFDPAREATSLVLEQVEQEVKPRVVSSGDMELQGLLQGLAGKFVAPGASGAPTRGRLDVLPTGRNFFSVDSRSVPTPAAWALGKKSAELLIVRHRQDHGEWPSSFGLSVWGTSNMRTGGDDIAQALALIGARPVWDHSSRRVTGYEIMTLAELGRPRIDVTLRISGFFRDAFPAQIDLFDQAIRAIGGLEEEAQDNPIAMRMQEEYRLLIKADISEAEAKRRSGYRIFGSKPGAYGAGLQAIIDEKGWQQKSDLADAYMAWGSYAYGTKETGEPDQEKFSQRLQSIDAVVQNQDNREHDLLDSDDYYQFEGGMTAAVEQASGTRPAIYHNDHSRPEKPVIRALDEEIARVVRARAANPKWIEGVKRHGYKGAFEMAATVDYLFAFSATTGAVRNHHFDLVYEAYLGEDDTLEFLQQNNPEALKEMAARFLEAEQRGLWTPRSNSAKFALDCLVGKADT